jgi:hypothetical protein
MQPRYLASRREDRKSDHDDDGSDLMTADPVSDPGHGAEGGLKQKAECKPVVRLITGD